MGGRRPLAASLLVLDLLLAAGAALPAPPAGAAWSVEVRLGPGGQAVHHVHVSGFAYDPGSLSINVGDGVEWHNHDSVVHTATDDGGAWDTGDLGNGQSATLTFDAAAEYGYHCAYHSFMTATLTVMGGGNQAPTASFSSPAEGAEVQGVVAVTGTAADPDGSVVEVEVRVEGGLWEPAQGTTSWSFSWDTKAVGDGPRTLEARAVDDEGAAGSPVARTYQVRNGNEPPTVAITTPRPGAEVEGIVELRGTAGDPEGQLALVEWRVNLGDWKPATGLASWTATWDSRTVPDGVHTLQARSSDGVQPSAVAEVLVEVDNRKPDLTVESITITPALTFQNITARVRNVGDEAAGPFAVGFLHQSGSSVKRIGNLSVAGLGVNASVNVGLNWDVLGKIGNFTVIVRVDEAGVVEEHDEANNERSASACVPALLGLTCAIPGTELF